MGKSLRQSLLKKTLLVTAFLLGIVAQAVYSQSTLSPGDIAVVTVNADGDDNFDFVPLVDIEAGTEIYFTDIPYIEASGGLDSESGEGVIKYTAPSFVSAGTVASYSGSDENGFDQILGSFSTSVSGDNLIVYQADTDTTFLLGTGWAKGSSVWEHTGSNDSDIPSGLNLEDNTILSLGTTDNYQYEATNGLEGTANSLLALIGDETNWIEDDDNAFSAFSSSFSLIDPPTIAFLSASISGDEGDTVDLSVELVESTGEQVSIEVVFLSGASTASSSDINGFSTETVNFANSDSSGTTKKVTVTLDDDTEFEENEKAVFQFQNISTGTIITPAELTLAIKDNDVPDVVINEILYDPNGTGGDANGDGDPDDGTGDEFVEFINNSGNDLDISNWTLSEGAGVKYTFPSGTVIPANNAFVVFSAPAEGTNFGGAYLFASGSSLGLNNDGDEVILKDAGGNEITSVNYDGSETDESITRNPDITGDFEGHTTADSENGLAFSPGTKVDGSPFGSGHAIAFRGTEGWRMVASPVENATFDDFFGDLWMQGLTGSDDEGGEATIFSWSESGVEESGSFEIPGIGNMNDPIEPGKGYIIYVYEDDDNNAPGIQGGFPKVINTAGTENPDQISVSISATDKNEDGSINDIEGWNLLGNPFASDLSVGALISALEDVDTDTSVNANIYVWDHDGGDGNGEYVALSDGDRIAPFQAFFVRFTNVITDGSFQFDKNALEVNTGAEFFKNKLEEIITFDLELHGEQYFDTYSVEFSENGTADLDHYDAYKLFSLNKNSINLFSTHGNTRLQKNALPRELESTHEIPLSFDANGRTSLTFRWDNEFQNFPDEWDLLLIDNETNREIDLRRDEEYNFNVSGDGEQKMATSTSEKRGLLYNAKDNTNPRFTLSIQPKQQQKNQVDLPNSVKLNPNYPNPFNPMTTIPYELTENAEVKLTIWNMIGQKVATLVDGLVEAGTHEEIWNASSMPSGMYIARFEVGGKVFTRKMTLIK